MDGSHEMRGRSREEVLAYYRAQRAGGSDYVGYSEPSLKTTVLRTVRQLPMRDIVEIGAGPNPIVPFALAEAGCNVTVVDIAPDFIETALINAGRCGVSVQAVCAAAEDTGLPEASFDLALMTEVLEHLPDDLLKPALLEIRRILRPDGFFFVSVPNEFGLIARYQRVRAGMQRDPLHLRDFDHRTLRSLLEASGFRIVRPVSVPATNAAPWRAKSAWLIDRITFRPEWSLKVAFLARRA